MIRRRVRTHRSPPFGRLLLAILLCVGCGGPALTVDMPLHLEDHVDAATVVGSNVPADIAATVEWRFDQPQPDWKALLPYRDWPPTRIERTADALRVTLTEGRRDGNGSLHGGIYIDLPDWRPGEWAHVLVRVRTTGSVHSMLLGLNPREQPVPSNATQATFQLNGGITPVVRDGSVQTYLIRPNWGSAGARDGPWRRVGLGFFAPKPDSIDILSVSVVPRGMLYAEAPHGVRAVTIGDRIRRTLYMHAPGSIAYRVRVPEGGRLDAGLGVLHGDDSVTFRVRVRAGGDEETLFEERYTEGESWGQRSIDLVRFAGKSVTLMLEAGARQSGAVALWGAPTVSGTRSSDKPNVIFYVIDGGGADQMSVYGYNRLTTPNLDRLATEGALFEHAYSTSTSTYHSTPSFMTSLHHSLLGSGDRYEPLPLDVRTMAERFHHAGYATAVFTSNAYAGSVRSLERGVDVFRDEGVDPPSGSSVVLHRDFWDWRNSSPAEPYWVHVQTTDVHSDHVPLAPFAGLFAAGGKDQLARWDATLGAWRRRNAERIATEPDWQRRQWAETGIGRSQYWNLWRSLYDETLAHQDYQLGRFVERLRETGQWERTLLVIAADHSIAAGSSDFLLNGADSVPPRWQAPILRSSVSRVPLIFIWPGHVAGGRRFPQPVSMIDVLPTLLDLTGLERPDVLQGQSLAPLLLGREGWTARPVIFEQIRTTQGGTHGTIEMIDGRWGASLWIGPPHDDTTRRRPTPLLLFDVWNDPLALTLMNGAHPELVQKYTALLEQQWEAHRLLARRFTTGGTVELTPAQLETLRALGYIR